MKIDRDRLRGRFAAAGRLMPEEAAEMAAGALSAASAESLETVLLNFQDVSLTRNLSVTECHSVGEQLASAGARLGKVAIVVRTECVSAHPFLFTVAVNRGLRAATFQKESEAVRWLQAA